MDKVQNPSNSECHTPSSEPCRFYPGSWFGDSNSNRPVVCSLIFLTGSNVSKERKARPHRTQTALKPSNVLTRSGVNVAASKEQEIERAGMRREGSSPASWDRWRQSSISGAAGATRQTSPRYCSRARAYGTTHPNQYRIFAMLPTSVQFPLLFCPAILSVPTCTALQHQIPLRNQQSLLIPGAQLHKTFRTINSKVPPLDLRVSRQCL
jgi:hypothetical protein